MPFKFALPLLLLLLIFFFHFPLHFGQSSRHHRFGAVPHNLHTFPNPRADNKTAAKCNLDRGKLNGELAKLVKIMEAEKEKGGVECGWGIYLGIAIVNQPFYNHFQKESVEDIIRQKWALDPQLKCQRTAQLILVAKNCLDEKECIFTSIDSSLELALPKEGMAALIGQQKNLLQKGHFGQSLSNIVIGIQRISLHRIHIFSGKFMDEMPSRPIPFPLLILAFLLILVIWEFGKMSIQPKLKEWLKARKVRRNEGKKEMDKEELAAGDDGNGQEKGQFFAQMYTAVDPPNEQIEMIEQQHQQNNGAASDEYGCFKFTKRSCSCRRSFSKPQSSLQIYKVEENC